MDENIKPPFKMDEKTANVTMELAANLEQIRQGYRSALDIQKFAQKLVKHFKIKDVKYKPPVKGEAHGFDMCDSCQIYTQQSKINGHWSCDRCKRNTN